MINALLGNGHFAFASREELLLDSRGNRIRWGLGTAFDTVKARNPN